MNGGHKKERKYRNDENNLELAHRQRKTAREMQLEGKQSEENQPVRNASASINSAKNDMSEMRNS